MKVGVYISTFNRMGGVETCVTNICNRTGWDLIFHEYNLSALEKINSNCYRIGYEPKDYDVIIISTAWGRPPNSLRAKYFVQMIHADYEAYIECWDFVYKKYQVTTHHVAVGKFVSSQFEKVTPYKTDKVIYNILSEVPKVKKERKDTEILHFVTMSRISKEKGFERILKMAELLEGTKYTWDIYGDTSTAYYRSIVNDFSKFPNIKFRGVTNDVLNIVNKADYLVQLSDTEGFCYSMYESLSVLTPVIVTNFESAKEMVDDGENGYILDMDLSNFNIDKIKNVPLIKGFKEKSTEKDWFNLINDITNGKEK